MNIFNSVLEYAFRKLNWEEKEINLNGKRLTNLKFADVVLFGRNNRDIVEMIEKVATECEKTGLKMNVSKTKVMSELEDSQEITLSDGTQVEAVKEYSYLGSLISFRNKTDKETSIWVAKSWTAFWALKQIVKGKISLKPNQKFSVVVYAQ